MAFTGDLVHLPIVDVIQLLNSTRKSGVLTVKGRKGESELIFKDGYIVSASHLNNSVRIGQVLVEMGFVSQQQIERGLQKQQTDGAVRRPLAITLIEMGFLQEEDAHTALQRLIEMTIVEILTWKSGTFTLNYLKDSIDCDFKYYPEKMSHEININTQSILMDALRIFDEKTRDGLIEEELDETAAETNAGELISADDLGLSDIEQISAKLPQSFSGVASFDPALFQQKEIAALASGLSVEARDRLAAILARHTRERTAGEAGNVDAAVVLLCCQDKLLQHSLDTVLHGFGVAAVSLSAEDELEKTLLSDRKIDWLVIDSSVRSSLLNGNPGLKTLQFSKPNDLSGVLNAYRAGVRTVLPKPMNETEGTYVEDLIQLSGFLPEYLKSCR